MVLLLQLVATLFLAFVSYITFLHYKKKIYDTRTFAFWICVWIISFSLVIFPESSSFITQELGVTRVIDFYLILGLMFFAVISFFTFSEMRKLKKKLEELVQVIAKKK